MAKEKISIEYSLKNTSPNSVWNYISTANGLGQWFADKVLCDGKEYTFFWAKTPQTATQTGFRSGIFVRFHWNDDDDPKAYFEFRIHVIELTGEVMLEITDFTTEDEKEESIELWNEQIATLKRKLGT